MPLITFVNTYFDDDDEDETSAVQQLQQKLFPPVPQPNSASAPGGYFMNIIVKPNQGDDENSEQYLVKKESKELFAVVRDPSATIQAARWPTECQVNYIKSKTDPRFDCLSSFPGLGRKNQTHKFHSVGARTILRSNGQRSSAETGWRRTRNNNLSILSNKRC